MLNEHADLTTFQPKGHKYQHCSSQSPLIVMLLSAKALLICSWLSVRNALFRCSLFSSYFSSYFQWKVWYNEDTSLEKHQDNIIYTFLIVNEEKEKDKRPPWATI
jgi:hypothetical protein